MTPDTPTREPMELLPCPFCGGEPKVDGEDSTWAKLCRVRCGECNANRMSYANTRAEAIEAWNRRALPPPRPAEPTLTAHERYALDLCDQYLSLLAAQAWGLRTP